MEREREREREGESEKERDLHTSSFHLLLMEKILFTLFFSLGKIQPILSN
jgi:hypothetical protein